MINSFLYHPAQSNYMPTAQRIQSSMDTGMLSSQMQPNLLGTTSYIPQQSSQFNYQQQAPLAAADTSIADPMAMMQMMVSIIGQMFELMMGMESPQTNQQNADTAGQTNNTDQAGNTGGCQGRNNANTVDPNTDTAASTAAEGTPATTVPTSTPEPATMQGTTAAATDTTGASKTAVTQPAGAIDLKTLGVKGDGTTDDQAALQAALDNATPGQTLWLPPGTYNHSDVLKVPSGVTLSGAGDSTVLKATDANHAAVMLTGSKSALSNVKVTSDSATRIPNAEASAVWVNHADGAKVTNVTSIGSGANSVTVDRSTNSVIDHVLGVGSNADGIAINNGSTNNTIQNSVVRESGDDSFSDDSYKDDEVASSGNKFLNNLSVDNRYGDNYKFAGAANDTIEGNVSLGGPKGGIVIIEDQDSGTKASVGNVAKNNIAIDLPAPDVSAFMNPGGENNKYLDAKDAEAQKYIKMANETSGKYEYNKSYVAGTGPGANNRGGVHLYPTT
jgi:hypothetical protein